MTPTPICTDLVQCYLWQNPEAALWVFGGILVVFALAAVCNYLSKR